ncbi:hypothetical protein BX592_11978 [Paraburkholderia rhizosphaerae]|uniref:Uncharacterized protein n=1 Tax=Paraburkholderia rhizosphaerae TaxID=480658 RepID=A0A4R8LKB7_9BURK|nr:hypothetical protein BX592_11978 [Paraburkholderia rhizosphaerae]
MDPSMACPRGKTNAFYPAMFSPAVTQQQISHTVTFRYDRAGKPRTPALYGFANGLDVRHIGQVDG